MADSVLDFTTIIVLEFEGKDHRAIFRRVRQRISSKSQPYIHKPGTIVAIPSKNSYLGMKDATGKAAELNKQVNNAVDGVVRFSSFDIVTPSDGFPPAMEYVMIIRNL
jgi:hypothetical protein